MKGIPPELERVLREHQVDVGDGTLLTLALTHKSWVYEQKKSRLADYERLESLGDAVVQLAISDVLYKTFPSVREGDLARMRSAVVCEPSLAEAGARLKLGQAIRLGVGEEKSGGRKRVSLLADTYEALIGAVYLLSGWKIAQSVVLHTLSKELEQVVANRAPADPKSQLQELLQAKAKTTPVYRLIDEHGPDHAKRFFSEVIFEGKVLGQGEGRSKRDSEQAAAKEALRYLESTCKK